jgi:hypothetical protein
LKGELAPPLCVARRLHRVVGLEKEALMVLCRGETVRGAEVALCGLPQTKRTG